MEKMTPEQLNMKLPEYTYQVPGSKKWIVGMGLAVLLIVIIVAAILIGVYMTQTHTEKVMELVFNAKDEQKVKQTIYINEQENVAAIFTSSKEYSATVLYDYKRNIIGIRMINSSKCYVLKMDKSQIPPIAEILKEIDYVKTHNASTDADITYHIAPEQVANPIDVGMSVNLLCSDVTIYWARWVNNVRGWFKFPKISFAFAISIGRK